ncbi:MAG: HlyD family efflux transporter periplasmic adaptor subunit [Rhodobacteraceae bacterium]|nr:HlyD family efflux transporter periplasmic adaptor subunit [Paracoccaceae bacterium]
MASGAPQPSEHIQFPAQAALWKTLSDAEDLRDRCRSWAHLLFGQLTEDADVDVHAVCGFRFDAATQRMVPLGAYPANRATTPLMAQTAQSAGEQLKPTARGALPTTDSGKATEPMCAAVPLIVDGRAVGVACAEMTPDGEAQMRRSMRKLQWGAAWLRDQLRSEASDQKDQNYRAAVEALHTVVAVAEHEDFATSARAAVTDLATRFDCDRVALGLRRRRKSKVVAISHSAQFSRRMRLVGKLTAAMDEAIDQRATILWPETDESGAFATMMAEDLARDDHVGHVFTVPLFSGGRFVGALTFERPEDRPFAQAELDILEAVGTVLAPIIEDKRRNDRWLVTKAVDVAGNQMGRLFGPSYLIRKLIVLALVGLGVFFWFAKGSYQVGADAQVVGTIERSIVAGFDGFVAAAPVRAGALLGLLDDRDLLLERQRLVTQRERQQIEFDRAVAARDRAEVNIRQTMIEQADAEIALLDEQLSRTRLTAPFDGIVLSGDLSQSIGSAVSRGEQLMIVAPADAYRLKLQVDERQIADITEGQSGALRVTALPSETFEIEIVGVTPVATYAEGQTTFEVEAAFTGDIVKLRPGMQGAARIDVEERRLISIWIAPFVDWARVTLWRWAPV